MGKVYESIELLRRKTNSLEEINNMGKTGTTKWGRVKGRKGRAIVVPESEIQFKRPGPAQRYTSSGAKRRKMARSQKAVAK